MPGEKLDQSITEEIRPHHYKWYEFACKDASYLKTKADFTKLTFTENALLKFHLSICKYCRRFVKQMEYLDSMLKKNAAGEITMSTERKISINQSITEKLRKN